MCFVFCSSRRRHTRLRRDWSSDVCSSDLAPFAVTVDHQTLEDNTVTIRKRDSMEQTRISISEIDSVLSESVAFP